MHANGAITHEVYGSSLSCRNSWHQRRRAPTQTFVAFYEQFAPVFALLGRRDVMAAALRAADTLGQHAQIRARSGRQQGRQSCDFDRLMGTAVRRALPNAECIALPRGGSPVASVRGNVRDSCFFLDIESPPNDGEPQPRVGALRLDAVASVASQCLGLKELRDPRRPGTDAACAPRGGWDGDFRTDASPWDANPPNRGAG